MNDPVVIVGSARTPMGAFQGDFKVVGLLMCIGRSNCSTKTSVRDGGVAMYGRWKAKLAGRCVKCGR